MVEIRLSVTRVSSEVLDTLGLPRHAAIGNVAGREDLRRWKLGLNTLRGFICVGGKRGNVDEPRELRV